MTDDELNNYQIQAKKFVLPHIATNLEYFVLGLCGETGEVAEKIKKNIRDKSLDYSLLALELGDVLWYLTNIASLLDIKLSDIALANIQKLESRTQNNTIQGNGDIR